MVNLPTHPPPGAPTPQSPTPKPTLKDPCATCYVQFPTRLIAANTFTAENPPQQAAGVFWVMAIHCQL